MKAFKYLGFQVSWDSSRKCWVADGKASGTKTGIKEALRFRRVLQRIISSPIVEPTEAWLYYHMTDKGILNSLSGHRATLRYEFRKGEMNQNDGLIHDELEHVKAILWVLDRKGIKVRPSKVDQWA